MELDDVRDKRFEWRFIGGPRLGGLGGRYVSGGLAHYEIDGEGRSIGFLRKPLDGQPLWRVEFAGVSWGVTGTSGLLASHRQVLFGNGGIAIAEYHPRPRRSLIVDGLRPYRLTLGTKESRWKTEEGAVVATCSRNQGDRGPGQIGRIDVDAETELAHAPVIVALSVVLAAHSELFRIED